MKTFLLSMVAITHFESSDTYESVQAHFEKPENQVHPGRLPCWLVAFRINRWLDDAGALERTIVHDWKSDVYFASTRKDVFDIAQMIVRNMNPLPPLPKGHPWGTHISPDIYSELNK